MDRERIWKQLFGLDRAAFEGTFGTVALLQDKMVLMGNPFIEQADWIPKEGKKLSDEWTSACRKGREHFKRPMDEGFAKAEAFFARS